MKLGEDRLGYVKLGKVRLDKLENQLNYNEFKCRLDLS